MADMLGFWSYVHKDDELDFGRVSQLARDIVGHYEAIRDEKIELFLDRDDLHWGDHWREKVNESLGNVAFFIPILTPRFFSSVECRREFQFFIDRSKALGVPQLVLPILYIDVPGLADDPPSDDLMAAAKEAQWEPWTALRFSERQSGEYRSQVNRLAQEIANRVESAEAVDIVAAAKASDFTAASDDEAPGSMDRIAALEDALPRWTETLEQLSSHIQEIGAHMRNATDDTNEANAKGKGFAARLVIARRVAAELETPVKEIEGLARDWVRDLDSIDSGLRALFDRINEAFDENPEETRTFLRSIRYLSLAANQGLGGALAMVRSTETLADQSRDMRPVLRRLRSSLTSMAEARSITDSWNQIIADSGLLDPEVTDLPTELDTVESLLE